LLTKNSTIFIVTVIAYSIIVLRNFFIAIVTSTIIEVLYLTNQRMFKGGLRLLNKGIVFDFKGALIPLSTSVVIALSVFHNLDYMFMAFLISLAMALSSLNTVITKNLFAVNVLGYVLIYFMLSSILCGNLIFYPYILPLATQLGIIIGSDLLHGIYFLDQLKSKVLIVGGAGEYDAIYVSTIAIQWLEIFRTTLITFICRTRFV